MDRGAWWATVRGAAESDMAERLSAQGCTHANIQNNVLVLRILP